MTAATGYSLVGHGSMINSHARTAAYSRALQGAVQPGCVVMDIGAGTGLFSLLACRFGAGKVHAVEPDDTILVAQLIAADNGFADRLVFHKTLSTLLKADIRADVLVSDLHGVLPLFEHHLTAIADARDRFLVPGGTVIPARDRQWAALVEAPEMYEPYARPWLHNDFDLDLTVGHRFAVNSWRKVSASAGQLLAAPRLWSTIDYCNVDQPNVSGYISWRTERAGIAHGLLVWFDSELAAGIGYSNAPGQPEQVYGQAFFPLQRPVALEAGDQVDVRISAHLVDAEYIWRWNTRVANAAGTKADYRQSTFFGTPISGAWIKGREANHVPASTSHMAVDGFCLKQVDGTATLEEIAQRLVARFPDTFHTTQQAREHAADLLQRYPPDSHQDPT